ncbi:OmpP1/FadL family transporter [Rhizobium ruizarguesonis]|uniref:OmpP1/FadL family transporter n=1 Tax=Rhizobium ruizarguesonis TaxID=2081791 RepID=UPI00102FD778|nr:OmpP1/FadL family transporter [Rhizobium ruizarguesonis]TBY71175.1 transporter [Rhizobium leguminosarum bv. viciae]MBC2803547.1 transporter [Rhizobium ruizarguesonis]TAW56378.1 transporter [Rhizobium ruizarguesonis]TBA21060.1 transporter [Rhizobium ruizarguesonis]TBC78018.1 transporter [Rhizobium ruizarguesonis]
MASRRFSKGVTSLVLFSSLASPSFAGGLERGGYNIDQLFDTSPFSFQSGVTYVTPQRKLKDVRDTDTSTSPGGGNLNSRPNTADDTSNYTIPYIGFKAGFGDAIDCLVDYSEPFGGHTDPGLNWAGANNNIETEIKTRNYGGTCSYRFDVGPGQLRFIGGAFYQEVEGFKERLVSTVPLLVGTGNGVGRLDLEDSGWGWRAGLAYEIPEYAMRASLVYNSRVKYDNLTGTVDLTQVTAPFAPLNGAPYGRVTDVFGSAEAPDSLELKLQSGIAPDWLAFGSVKWTNWSVLQSVPFCPKSTKGLVACTSGGATELTSLDLLYQDGWTITGGVGHKFNEQWAGAVSLTWDRGTSLGYGAQTDSWTLGLGAAFTPTEHIEWRVAGAVGVLTSGSSGVVTQNGVTFGDDVSYSFDNDLVAALSTSLKIKF